MTIPDFQTIMKPLLKLTSDGAEYKTSELIDKLAVEFQLTDEERNTMQPSGYSKLFDNRAHWARKYLKEAGLVDAIKRGYIKITSDGLKVVNENPERITIKYLKQFDKFQEFEKINKKESDNNESKEEVVTDEIIHTPEDNIEKAYTNLKSILIQELLEKVKEQTPEFFETLVIDLLLKMGYGGSRSDAGHTTKRTGDEGIDGTIYEDRLGLDIIYIQAKKWDKGTIGRPEIQKFVGALHGQRAKKGIFITTSRFSNEAYDYTNTIESKVVLIDGEKLANLMIDFEVGVSKYKSFEIKRIDSDYFEAE